jgi:hypothetical protein
MGGMSSHFAGRLQNNDFAGGKDVGRFYRATVSIRNYFAIRRYSKSVRELQPVPPITGVSPLMPIEALKWRADLSFGSTGRSLPELFGVVQYIVEEPDAETGALERQVWALVITRSSST